MDMKPPAAETFMALGEFMIRPTLPLLTMHRGFAKAVGTGFLLKHLSAHYLVSAAHLLEDLSVRPLFFYTEPNKTRLVSGGYNSTSALSGRQHSDTWDVGVVRLDGDLPPYNLVNTYSLPIEILKPRHLPRDGGRFFAAGYPASKGVVNRPARTIQSEALVYAPPSSPLDVYEKIGLSPATNIVMPFHVRKSHDEKFNAAQQMPDPVGMSGGPLWIVEQISGGYLFPWIVGVLIEHRRPEGVMIATDVGIVHSLIRGLELKRKELGVQHDDQIMEHWPGRQSGPKG
jgi:hypothetical protein